MFLIRNSTTKRQWGSIFKGLKEKPVTLEFYTQKKISFRSEGEKKKKMKVRWSFFGYTKTEKNSSLTQPCCKKY